jgi:hypothetical protein
VALVGVTVLSPKTSWSPGCRGRVGLRFLRVTFLMRWSSHSSPTSLAPVSPLTHSPSSLRNSWVILGSASSRTRGSSPRPKPTVCGLLLTSPFPWRTVLWDDLLEGNAGRKVDRPSSSSEEYGISGAVLKDSAVESVVSFEAFRSLSGGRRSSRLAAGPGGVRSGVRFGVGGVCRLGGVTGR